MCIIYVGPLLNYVCIAHSILTFNIQRQFGSIFFGMVYKQN